MTNTPPAQVAAATIRQSPTILGASADFIIIDDPAETTTAAGYAFAMAWNARVAAASREKGGK